MKDFTSEILTSAVPLIRVQSISIITATAEAPDGVSAPPIGAQSVYHSALIYIYGVMQRHKHR